MTAALKAVGAAKLALLGLALTALTALAATSPSLPAAADAGQATASAAAQHGKGPSVAHGGEADDVAARLTENKVRLLSPLDHLLAQLQANAKANHHAIDALERIIARISAGEHGLGHASQSVTSHGSPVDHPGPNDHPGPP